MKKLNLFMSIVVMVGLMALPLYAAERSETSSHNEMSQSNSFHINDLIGKTIKDKQGNDLGKVDDLMVQKDGTASFVILSRGGILGAGATYYPIPFTTFISSVSNLDQINTDRDLTASLSKTQMDSGPNFSDKQAKELSGRDLQEKICSHYAAQCRLM